MLNIIEEGNAIMMAGHILGTIDTELATGRLLAMPRRFEDLHEVCDANEYILDAEKALGLATATRDDSLFERDNKAVDLVNAHLIRRATTCTCPTTGQAIDPDCPIDGEVR